MGGTGSGGARSGAGRKKKPTHLRAIDGGADHRTPTSTNDAMPAIAEPASIEPPADFARDELIVWNEWAPRAQAERTLTPTTLGSFVQLCQLEADRRELRGRYTARRSPVTGELLPLLVMGSDDELAIRREHRNLAKDINAKMKDFKLAPFGKEILPSGAGAAEDDPLDQFTRRRG
jgi:hypothetical protein